MSPSHCAGVPSTESVYRVGRDIAGVFLPVEASPEVRIASAAFVYESAYASECDPASVTTVDWNVGGVFSEHVEGGEGFSVEGAYC